jgi:hypothetical protein
MKGTMLKHCPFFLKGKNGSWEIELLILFFHNSQASTIHKVPTEETQ